MTDLIASCPSCTQDFPVLTVIAHLTICPHCFLTLALNDATSRRANAIDAESLTPTQLASARQALNTARRAK